MPLKKANKGIIEDPEELRTSAGSPRPAGGSDDNTTGVVSKVVGRPRPRYPSIATPLCALGRTFITSCVVVLIHHFLVVAWIAPRIFSFLKGNAVQSFIATNGVFQWFASNSSWSGSRMAARGQDTTDMLFFAFGIGIIHAVCYFIFNGGFALVTFFDLLPAYKIPVKENQRPTSRLIVSTLLDNAIQTFVAGPAFLALLFIVLGRNLKHVDTLEQLVSWEGTNFLQQVLHICGSDLTNIIVFHIIHQAVHELPGVYAKIHKQHHNWLAVSSIAAEFAHPLEAIFSNVLPTLLYLLVFPGNFPYAAIYSWTLFRLWETNEAHSNYDFRGTFLYHIGFIVGNSAHHSWHHSRNNGNYGNIFSDYVAGTMDFFLKDGENGEIPVAAAIKGTVYDFNKKQQE